MLVRIAGHSSLAKDLATLSAESPASVGVQVFFARKERSSRRATGVQSDIGPAWGGGACDIPTAMLC
jgi:hypothetical protein